MGLWKMIEHIDRRVNIVKKTYTVCLFLLHIIYKNAKIHAVFDAGISGRVADCKVGIWSLGRDARFTLVRDQVEFG